MARRAFDRHARVSARGGGLPGEVVAGDFADGGEGDLAIGDLVEGEPAEFGDVVGGPQVAGVLLAPRALRGAGGDAGHAFLRAAQNSLAARRGRAPGHRPGNALPGVTTAARRSTSCKDVGGRFSSAVPSARSCPSVGHQK